MSWTAPALDMLKKRWIEGVSASDISKLLARDLGISKTRNAVIGKVHRLGMGSWGRDTPAKPVAYRPAKAPKVRALPKSRPPRPGPQNRPAVIHGKGTGADFTDAPELADIKRAQYRSEGLSIVQRVEAGAGVESLNARPFFEGSGCKWPLADGMRCCNPLARGAYCEGHAAVAYSNDWVPKASNGTSTYAPSLLESRAAWFTRFERIDRADAKTHRPKPAASIWDEGRAA